MHGIIPAGCYSLTASWPSGMNPPLKRSSHQDSFHQQGLPQLLPTPSSFPVFPLLRATHLSCDLVMLGNVLLPNQVQTSLACRTIFTSLLLETTFHCQALTHPSRSSSEGAVSVVLHQLSSYLPPGGAALFPFCVSKTTQ